MAGSEDGAAVRFDVWVCRGRLCSAAGSARVVEAFTLSSAASPRVTVQRGGCYGLCELGPNVVVRRRPAAQAPTSIDDDRLSLAGGADETVYCGVAVADVAEVLGSHLTHDAPLVRLSRAVREKELVPRTPIEERIRALRAARAKQEQAGVDDADSSDDEAG
jgi:(2Fe-2S) ferredoxin